MDHHVARDLLGGYVDDELEPATRAQLEDHLATCDDCRALLDEAGSAPVGRLRSPTTEATTAWDQRRMQRTVRLTLLRTSVQAVALTLLGLLAVWLIVALVVQPLLVARGDRMERAAQAAFDLPMLFTPGTTAPNVVMETSWLHRRFVAEPVHFVGGRERAAEPFDLEVGVRAMRLQTTLPWLPGPAEDAPEWDGQAAEGTAVAVQLAWGDPIPLQDTQALVPPGVGATPTLTWAAFAVEPLRGTGVTGGAWDPTTDVGYSTCQGLPATPIRELRWANSASFRGEPIAGIADAVAEVRRATANLAATPELQAHLDLDAPVLARIDEVAVWLADNEPAVSSVVLTGPAPDVAEVVEAADADLVLLLDIDFDRGTRPLC